MDNELAFRKLFASLPKSLSEDNAFFYDVCNCAEIITLAKGDYLLRAGQPCTHGYFVNKGMLLHLYVNSRGEESVMGMSADELYPFFSSPEYFTGQPSGFELKAIEEVEVLAFPRYQIDLLSEKYPAFASYFKEIMLMVISKIYTLTAVRQSNTPEELLRYLYANHVWIVNRVPDKYIAQFIGISNEWYCKLKKKVLMSLG